MESLAVVAMLLVQVQIKSQKALLPQSIYFSLCGVKLNNDIPEYHPTLPPT